MIHTDSSGEKLKLSKINLGTIELIATISLFIYSFVGRFGTWPNHDISWYTYVASQMLHGVSYQERFADPNGPIAALLVTPAALLWNWGVDIAAANSLQAHGTAALSILACRYLYRDAPISPVRRVVLTVVVTFTLLLLPSGDFGQREHFSFMLILPFTFLAVRRMEQQPVSIGLAIAVGAMAGLGSVIKPYFLLTPLCIEAVVLWTISFRKIIRIAPEIATVLFIAAIGPIVTLTLNPTYISSLETTIRYYNAYGSWSNVEFLGISIGILLISGTIGAWPANRNLVAALLATGTASLVEFLIEHHGWTYHALPAMSAGTIFIAYQRLSLRMITAITLPASVTIPLLWWLLVPALPSGLDMAPLTQLLRREASGPVLFLSSNVYPGVPVSTVLRREWGGRWPCLFLLPGLVRAEHAAANAGQAPPTQERVDADLLKQTVAADIDKLQPTVILVRRLGDQGLPGDFDILSWLSRSPAFTSAVSAYREADGIALPTGDYRVFERAAARPLTPTDVNSDPVPQ